MTIKRLNVVMAVVALCLISFAIWNELHQRQLKAEAFETERLNKLPIPAGWWNLQHDPLMTPVHFLKEDFGPESENWWNWLYNLCNDKMPMQWIVVVNMQSQACNTQPPASLDGYTIIHPFDGLRRHFPLCYVKIPAEGISYLWWTANGNCSLEAGAMMGEANFFDK